MQHLCNTLEEGPAFAGLAVACQVWVRFIGLYRIEQHDPLVVRSPVNSFEF